MFSFSFGEILVIAMVGLIVIGPERLPGAARFLGHLFGRVRRQVNEVRTDIQRGNAIGGHEKAFTANLRTRRGGRTRFFKARRAASPKRPGKFRRKPPERGPPPRHPGGTKRR